jgi:DNA-directed RNA polymerase subunit H (RpoH/RPB5)
MLDNEFINKEFLQNCGDSLLVIEKTTKRQNNICLFRCLFQKYPYEVFSTKQRIINGQVNNPQIEIEEFIKKKWLQHCGDSLKIIRKTDIKRGNFYLWEAEFIKYPYKILAGKTDIIKGQIRNPQIEKIEFIDKLWPQNCGDVLRIVRKSDTKQGREFLWECEFLNYPCVVFAQKQNILRRRVKNPYIEKEEFLNKEFLQNCGDILRVIEKTDKKQNNISLYRCKFINYPCEVFAQKSHVLEGTVLNSKVPWIDREETQVRDFIKSIYNGEIIKYSGKKEENYLEIDIYFPELKKGIEYNGSPWHEEGNQNNKFSKPIGYHRTKQEIFAKKGIEILFVWDYEWFNDFPKNKIINEQTKQKIKDFIYNI